MRAMIRPNKVLGAGNPNGSFDHRHRVQTGVDFPNICQSNVVRYLTDGQRNGTITSKQNTKHQSCNQEHIW